MELIALKRMNVKKVVLTVFNAERAWAIATSPGIRLVVSLEGSICSKTRKADLASVRASALLLAIESRAAERWERARNKYDAQVDGTHVWSDSFLLASLFSRSSIALLKRISAAS